MNAQGGTIQLQDIDDGVGPTVPKIISLSEVSGGQMMYNLCIKLAYLNEISSFLNDLMN